MPIAPAGIGFSMARRHANPRIKRALGGAFLASASLFFFLHAEAAQPAAAAQPTAAKCVLKAKPDTLFSLMQCCVADLRSSPDCRSYNAADKYVIIKDNGRKKPAAYLIVPSTKVTGVEDPKIFAAPYVDLWQYAWNASRRYLNEPAAVTGLAINSLHGRDQNQLHIHISCVSGAVAQTLAANERKIGSDPAKPFAIPLGPHGDRYEVLKLTSLSGASSPFTLVRQIPGARDHMADQSIAVIGSQTQGLYYLADSFTHAGNSGFAEELLDQTCGRKSSP